MLKVIKIILPFEEKLLSEADEVRQSNEVDLGENDDNDADEHDDVCENENHQVTCL